MTMNKIYKKNSVIQEVKMVSHSHPLYTYYDCKLFFIYEAEMCKNIRIFRVIKIYLNFLLILSYYLS